jgi:chromosome segregation ATPase
MTEKEAKEEEESY